MTEFITKPKKDDPDKPKPDPTTPERDEETSPMDYVGTGSVPEGESKNN